LEHETQQSKQAKEIETSTTTPRLAQQLNTQFLRLPFLIAARLAASAVRASKAAALWMRVVVEAGRGAEGPASLSKEKSRELRKRAKYAVMRRGTDFASC